MNKKFIKPFNRISLLKLTESIRVFNVKISQNQLFCAGGVVGGTGNPKGG